MAHGALGLTHPTLRRHIETLEALLGTPLFTRSPAGLLPTPVALSLRPSAEAMEAAAARLLRDATAEASEPAGTLRLTASEIIGAEVLPPLLAELRERHPRLDIELVLSNETLDVLRRDADIAVRMHPPRPEGLLARRLGAVRLGFFAASGWLVRHGAPRDLQALIEARALIGPDRDTALPCACREGFHARRWVVERFFAWIGRNRSTQCVDREGPRGHQRLRRRLPLHRLRHHPATPRRAAHPDRDPRQTLGAGRVALVAGRPGA